MLDTVKDFLARAATNQAGTQLQLVMRDPECRMAVGAAGSERHCLDGLSFVVPAGQGDPAIAFSPDSQIDEGRIGCDDLIGLACQYARQHQ